MAAERAGIARIAGRWIREIHMGLLEEPEVVRLRQRAAQFPDTFVHGFTDAAAQVHAGCTVIDLHSDPMLQWCYFRRDFAGKRGPPFERLVRSPAYRLVQAIAGAGRHRPLFDHTDVPRMSRAGVDGAVFGLHWYPPGIPATITPWGGLKRQLKHLHRKDRERSLRVVHTPDELASAMARRQFAACAGIEGWHALGRETDSLEVRLDRLAEASLAGVAYLTVNHHTDNDAAANSWSMFHQGDVPDPDAPLGPSGPAVISRCNALGLMLDVTHTNIRGITEICRLSRSPVIASHAGARLPGRTDQYACRELSPKSILAIARTGGCIGVPFCPVFLTGTDDASLSAVVRHLDYIRGVVDREAVVGPNGAAIRGSDCVCLGTDFDGWIPSIPLEMDGVEDLPLLTQLLLDAGWSAGEVAAMYGGNFLRVWRDTLRVAGS